MADTTLSFNVLAKDNATRTIGKIGQSFGNLHMSVGKVMTGLVAIGPALAGLAIGAGLKDFVDEARESRRIGALTTQVIKSTGGAAKLSAEQVGDLATAISNKTGADDEAVQSGENLLLTFTNIKNGVGKGNDIFNQATQAVTDMTAAMNDGQVTQDGMKTASIQLGKALNDPIKGVTALSKVGVSFTEDQKKQIKTLVDSGKTMEAQKIILNELGKEFGGAAAAATDPLTKLGTIVGNVKETIGTALLPVVDSAATLIGKNLPGAVDTAGRFFSTKLLPPLRSIAGFTKDQVIPRVRGIVTEFAGLGGRIVKAIGKVDLGGIAFDIFAGASKWASSLINGLKAGVEKGNWKPLGTAIGDGIATGLRGAGDVAQKILDGIGTLLDKVDWGRLGGRISGGVLGMLHSIDWGKLGDTIGDALISIIRKASSLGQKLGMAFKEMVGKVDWKKIGHDSSDAIGQFISGVDWGRLAKTLGVMALKSLKINATIIDSILGAAADLVIGIFDAIIDEMSVQRVKLVGWTKRVGGDLVAGLWSGIKSGMGAVGKFIKSTIVDPIINWAKSGFGIHSPSTVFAGIGANLITGLKNGILGGVRGIGTWVYRNMISPAVAPFSRAATWLVQGGRNFVSGFTSGVVGFLHDVKGIGNWIRSNVISPLVAPFAGAVGWLKQEGRDVISGFLSGMTARWTDVTKWVGGIASWIKDHKGPISLDSRLLIPAGEAIMSGFLKGLKSGAGPAWSFVSSVGGKTVDALRSAIGGPFMGGDGPAPTNLSGMQALFRTIAAKRGWGTGSQWDALYNLEMGEAGFNPNAQNPTSTAYGFGQFLDSTWATVGGSKTSDPWLQAEYMMRYISRNYGDPQTAYSKWLSRSPHWYKQGTPWVPDDQLAYLHKGEAVIPAEVNKQRLRGGSGGSDVHIHLHGTEQQLMDQLVRKLDDLRRQGRLQVTR